MAIRSTFTTGEVLTAADLTDTIKGAFINTETSTARTLGTADAGNLVTLNNNSGGTVTIPTNTTWGSPLGTLVHLVNIGTAGSFTVGTAAGVTLNAASASLAIQEGGTLIKTSTNTWQFVKGGGLGKAQYSSTTGSPTVTTVSGKTCVQFTGSGSITISQAGTVEVLVVGGGGGGGGGIGGGGGGGGVLSAASQYLPSGTLTVTVGGGGAFGTGGPNSRSDPGISGTSSQLDTLYGVGGGGGAPLVIDNTGLGFANPGQPGGSGAGGSYGGAGGAGLSAQGNAGGSSAGTGTLGAGGGGGRSGAGSNGTTTVGGNGGAGLSSSITGSAVTYGSGGGGGNNGGTAGTGGTNAGNGSNSSTAATAASPANRGCGGGGGGNTVSARGNGGNGSSGIVILLFG